MSSAGGVTRRTSEAHEFWFLVNRTDRSVRVPGVSGKTLVGARDMDGPRPPVVHPPDVRASGELTQRRDTDDTVARLTPTELQVASVVARGLPTHDLAPQLSVSARTVDLHLRYRQAAISSRTELAHAAHG